MANITLSLIMVALSATTVFGAVSECHRKVDRCVQDILPFSTTTKLGEKKEEIARDCAKAVAAVKCLGEVTNSNCTRSGVALGVFKLMVEGAETESTQRCDVSHPRRQEYEKYISCLNKVGSKLRDCQRKTTSEFEAIIKLPVNTRVPNACCAFSRLDKCMRDVAEKNCSKEHATYVSSIVRGVSEAVVDTVCTKYKATTCSKLAPIRASRKTTFQTMVTPLVEILNV